MFRACVFCAHILKGVLETLGNQLKQLEEEIKADEAGKQEFERLLAQVGHDVTIITLLLMRP